MRPFFAVNDNFCKHLRLTLLIFVVSLAAASAAFARSEELSCDYANGNSGFRFWFNNGSSSGAYDANYGELKIDRNTGKAEMVVNKIKVEVEKIQLLESNVEYSCKPEKKADALIFNRYAVKVKATALSPIFEGGNDLPRSVIQAWTLCSSSVYKPCP